MHTKKIFHLISYLQYPLIMAGVFFIFRTFFTGFDTLWENYNYTLIFFGVGISLSTLQDTNKTQNKLSLRVWQNPKSGKTFIAFLTLMTFFFITIGLIGLIFSEGGILKEIAVGLTVLGIGFINLLKAAIEMFENHRTDKNPAVEVIE
ncbi:MAG: hypothetical protein JJU28_02470 [Cyclobacteriaceae bacterium]|nr:hypothetical protein [Cyclobacteriaceae bacterium]